MRWLLLLPIVVIVLACTATNPPLDAGKDSNNPIDCSKVGCAQPPPCGQVCTATCGCCGCATGAMCSVCDGGGPG